MPAPDRKIGFSYWPGIFLLPSAGTVFYRGSFSVAVRVVAAGFLPGHFCGALLRIPVMSASIPCPTCETPSSSANHRPYPACGGEKPTASTPPLVLPTVAAMARWRRSALVVGTATGVVILLLAGWL